MQVERDRLVWLALGALSELVERAGEGPVPPSCAIRLTLAFLHSVSNGDRSPFDCFWNEMQNPYEFERMPHVARYCRMTNLQASLRGITRGVGWPESPEAEFQIRKAWERPSPSA